ncbi:hypothetical protein ACHAXT_013105 [Thalassiosira profunda]
MKSCSARRGGPGVPASGRGEGRLASAGRYELSDDSPSWADDIAHAKRYKSDKVKRVVDASTVQLEKIGYVSLESVRGAGSTYQLPDCFANAPSYKLRQLLPKGTAVRVVSLDDVMQSAGGSGATSTPRMWLIRDKDGLLVNEELVRTGFALVRKGAKAPPGMMTDLIKLEQSAKEQGLGIYKSCTDSGATDSDSNFVAEFEELDFTTEIQYGDDGGKSVLVSKREASISPPQNPGDVKACFDFATYEEALGWYERYAPYYGDVAKLDRDGDGVPCPGLPHTTVAEKYRMKRPMINPK